MWHRPKKVKRCRPSSTTALGVWIVPVLPGLRHGSGIVVAGPGGSRAGDGSGRGPDARDSMGLAGGRRTRRRLTVGKATLAPLS